MKFKNREEAGKLLAGKLSGYKGRKDAIVLGIPRGGVPVAYALARELKLPFNVLVSRKLPLPWDTEAGFGAVAENGVLVEDERFIKTVSRKELSYIIRFVTTEVARRVALYRKGNPIDVKGKVAILVDDGLAGGWTIAAAVASLKKLKAKKIIVAVPCASSAALKAIRDGFEVRVLKESDDPLFAVSLFYEAFQQLTDDQALEYLKEPSAPMRAVKKLFGKS